MSDQEDVPRRRENTPLRHASCTNLFPDTALSPPSRTHGRTSVDGARAERKRLIDERLAVDAEERGARSLRIASALDLAVGRVSGRIISGYWPFRGEPDLRNWAIR